MARERCSVHVEFAEAFKREESALGQHGIEACAAMSLAQNEAIAVRPVRSPGVHAEHSPVENGKHVSHRKRRSDMAALRAMSHPEDMPTDCGGKPSMLRALLLRAHRRHKRDSFRLGPTAASQVFQEEREEDTDEETSGAGYGQVHSEA